VTAQIASRWVKAAFLAVLGIVILLYADEFVRDMKVSFEHEVTFAATWDLLTILLWILVAWLFVDAGLTVALSFTDRRYSLADVMERLDLIEKKLAPTKPKAAGGAPGYISPPVTEGAPEEPPPPNE